MEDLLRRVGGAIVDHSARTLVAVSVVGVVAGFFAGRIGFDTSFAALLPEETSAVREVNWVKEKAGGTVDLIIALGSEGPVDKAARRAFARRLVQRLEAEPWIHRADAEYPLAFFEERKLLLLTVDELEALREGVEDDVARAKSKTVNPLFVDIGENGAPWSSTEAVLKEAEGRSTRDGVLKEELVSLDDRYGFVRVKPRGTSYDMEEGKRTLARVDAIVRSLDPAESNLTVRYSGAMPVNQEQHQIMTTDLRRAFGLALVLVLLVLTAFTREVAAPVVIAFPLVVGLTVTLGITEITLGQLNIVSGFLVTALVGIGVDYAIHLYLRFLEEVRRGEDKRAAMAVAMECTFPACLTSALTTLAAFLAMSISDFRGFQEYGRIAGMGVVVALVATFAGLPPLALMLTRTPGVPDGARASRDGRDRGVRNVRIGHAWAVVAAGVLLTAYSAAVSPNVRFYNEFKKKLRGYAEASEFQSNVVEKALGGSLNPAVVAVSSLEEARTVEAAVQTRMAEPNTEFQRVLSLATLVPEDLEAREAIVREIRDELSRLPREKLDREGRDKLGEYESLLAAQPWKLEDVPDRIARLFRSIDRTLQFVFIWPSNEMAEDTEIISWASALDELQAFLGKNGLDVPLLDENRVAARVLTQIRADGPRVVLYGFLGVLGLLIIDFRSARRVVLVGGALVVGFLWMFGWMVAFGFDLNVFNMAVLPTVLGIGIDNAVHLMHRYRQEGPGSVGTLIRTTGAAAMLASVTTGIGFASTLVAHHNGIKSMGELAVVGFVATLLASTVLFPAVLRVLEGNQVSGDGRTRPAGGG